MEQQSNFSPNPVRILWCVMALFFGILIALDLDPTKASWPSPIVWGIKLALIVVPAGLIAWFSLVRLNVGASSINYKSLLGRSVMDWCEVEKVFLSRRKTLLYGLIPLGTRYGFRLEASNPARVESLNKSIVGFSFSFERSTAVKGKTLSFGNSFENGEEITKQIEERTFSQLWSKAKQAYDRGQVVEFGGIGVSRDGMFVKPLSNLGFEFASKSIFMPWGEFELLLVNGVLRIVSNEKNVAQFSVASTPNISVMFALLNAIHSSESAKG